LNQIPWYFSKIRVDPSDADRLYVLGVQVHVTEDGGRTWRSDGARSPHVDHHAMWIDPSDPDHLVLGNDGGLYLSHDRGRTWDFTANLPITQYYAIAVDMREPHYFIYGGTQDNRTWGGPSETRNRAGILNSDWFQTVGGDGFYAAIDPTDPDPVYSESQNGGLIRYDGRTGERKSIRPQPKPGDKAYRFNWSAPLLISPHDPKTLYFGANVLFRSADRGDAWTILGGDLTRERNRDELPLMGKTWPKDAVSRHEGTAEYGNISTLDESTLTRGLLYVGTDDGLVQVSRDGGVTWTKYDTFPGVPAETYVSRVVASRHAEATVYVTLDGHRSNDFAPYVLKSTDYGKTWTSIASNLPKTGSVHVIREGLRNPKLLFAGTECGLFASLDTGATWARMTQGFLTVAVHDIVVHPRDGTSWSARTGADSTCSTTSAPRGICAGRWLVAPARPSVPVQLRRSDGRRRQAWATSATSSCGAEPAVRCGDHACPRSGADRRRVTGGAARRRRPRPHARLDQEAGYQPRDVGPAGACALRGAAACRGGGRAREPLPAGGARAVGASGHLHRGPERQGQGQGRGRVEGRRDGGTRSPDPHDGCGIPCVARAARADGCPAGHGAGRAASGRPGQERTRRCQACGRARRRQRRCDKAHHRGAKTADDIIAKVRGAQRPPDAAEETRPSVQQAHRAGGGEIGSVNSLPRRSSARQSRRPRRNSTIRRPGQRTDHGDDAGPAGTARQGRRAVDARAPHPVAAATRPGGAP
jgi:photosystem II stability/assembly factor-like uncharacterized protein